ncbi:GIY-YIG nuclease family protein [Pseudoalteromonas sp. MMG010]|uniref:GIY-YIG nuclease family protein n=1 Tax=Pseudoalteromonas sp. MMG010 TaxID=2822685 RepID=UPI001B3A0F83|nr:GIY-YIG nuclease family protein [Pseudoalteromonas sp. MMG010]MBQ4831734.1 GIY-YIG nuclease family protein [Pseudoalteromonas sp. MMG010]
MTAKSEKSLIISKSNNSAEPLWFLYIVETRYGAWYTGITTDVNKRLATHQAGKGAKNLKGKGPLVLIHQQAVGNKSEASKLEYAIKKLSRAKKQQYVYDFKLNVKEGSLHLH